MRVGRASPVMAHTSPAGVGCFQAIALPPELLPVPEQTPKGPVSRERFQRHWFALLSIAVLYCET